MKYSELLKVVFFGSLVFGGLTLAERIKAEVIDLDYKDFDVLYSCSHKGYELFHYTLGKDTGNEQRVKPFHEELALPKECRNTNDYKLYKKITDVTYDRGHGVDSNAFDNSIPAMQNTNSLANVLPQEMNLNRHGVWRHMERMVNCYRNNEPLMVVGGAIFKTNEKELQGAFSSLSDIPLYFWKTIYFMDSKKSISILVQNTELAGKDNNFSNYIVSTDTIKSKIIDKDVLVVLEKLQLHYPEVQTSELMNIPKGCDLK